MRLIEWKDKAVGTWVSVRHRLGLFLVCVALFTGAAHEARGQAMAARIIGDDRGGYVGERTREIAALNAQKTRVELRGRICYSSCTLYLGADNLCVSPTTVFGFHGPSRHGQTLTHDQFEHWSAVMARHYLPSLRKWFMDKARHRLRGYHRLTGQSLIDLGYPACA